MAEPESARHDLNDPGSTSLPASASGGSASSDSASGGSASSDSASSDSTGGRPSSPVDKLARLWWVWFAAYFLLGIVALQRGTESVLAGTADRVESTAIALLFLNLPLQMTLALTAIVLDQSPYRSGRRIGAGIAVTTTLLILIHLIISFVTSIRIET